MEYTPLILSLLLIAFSVYIKDYIKTKGKNQALKEDLTRLEEEKQSVIAKYRAETEVLKKSHALDIEKRKYQYATKKEQFIKLFSMLDAYNNSCHEIAMEKFPPILNIFMSAHEEDQDKAYLIFIHEMQKLFSELNQELIKVKHETNTIRIISSPKMDLLLDKLDKSVQAATTKAGEMLKFMSTAKFWEDQSLVIPYQERSELAAQDLIQAKNSLIVQMKKELSEI